MRAGAPASALHGPRVLVLQHVEQETAGAFAPVLKARGIELVTALADRPPLPDWRTFGGILAMGGPMGACDEAQLPWLAAEKALIGAAVRAGTPFLGVCLGAQLLAASLGAEVWPGPEPEIGVLTIDRTPDGARDGVFAACGPRMRVLQWHGDSFDLPTGARRLWTSRPYSNQAFRAGRCAYGVQFHLEATAHMVRRWADLPSYGDALAGCGRSLDALLADLERHEREIVDCAHVTIARWADRHVICHHRDDRRRAPPAVGEIIDMSSKGPRGPS